MSAKYVFLIEDGKADDEKVLDWAIAAAELGAKLGLTIHAVGDGEPDSEDLEDGPQAETHA